MGRYTLYQDDVGCDWYVVTIEQQKQLDKAKEEENWNELEKLLEECEYIDGPESIQFSSWKKRGG